MLELQVNQSVHQQLALTPALRLSLEILQMPLAELQTFLSQQLEQNPLLELQETQENPETASESSPSDSRDYEEEIFKDLWRQADNSSADADEEAPTHEFPARPILLHDHLLLQLRCLAANPEQLRIAEVILGWLDPDGYLREELTEIAHSVGCAATDVEEALRLIHRLDPPGVGARSLPECLLIQLVQRHEDDGLAARIVREHFDLLAARKIRTLASKLRVPLAEVQTACQLISHLNPKPARNFASESAPLQYPDLIIDQVQSEYHVELNDHALPRVGFNARYRSLLHDPSVSGDTKVFLRQKMRQAVWLFKAIHQRHDTLLAVARRLVDLEQDYLVHGIGALKPLTQEQVARLVGCHASTISRAIAGKSIQTPYGILPLEAFFGGGIKHPDQQGTRVSPRTVQAEIEHLIASENPSRPLSDQQLMAALKARGYPVARRTVAKYRTALKVLPAYLRRHTFAVA